MSEFTLEHMEGFFILGFGVCHFFFPVLFKPNLTTSLVVFSIHLPTLVTPGSIILALLSVVFYYFKDRYSMVVLTFMYLCGAIGHVLFLLGIIPPLLIIPLDSALFFGAVLDIGTPIMLIDYHRRHSKNKYYS